MNRARGVIITTEYSDPGATKLIKCYEEGIIDGILLIGLMPKEEIIRFKEKKIPFVLLDHEFKDVECDCVIPDSYQGSRMAVTHLLGLGHTRIAFLDWDSKWRELDRRQGYVDALSEAGFSPPVEYIQAVGGGFGPTCFCCGGNSGGIPNADSYFYIQ